MKHALAMVGLGLMLTGCASGRFGPNPDIEAPQGPHTLKKLSVEERRQVLQRAHVWQAIDTASLNLMQGPALPRGQRIGAETTCTYAHPDQPLTGGTPKFDCAIPPSTGREGKVEGKDDVVKVKYGEKNGEVYAEVAASRLLWALGFKADTMLPTRVTCHHCPADPFAISATDWRKDPPKDVATRVFSPAVIERDMPGKKVETPGYEGWAWPELDTLSTRRAQVDALKLLAVFIQHSDSKPDQQAIVCEKDGSQKDAKGNETCRRAWLVIKDLGATFGKATRLNSSKMNLADWDSVPVWKIGARCVGNLPRSMTGSLEDPVISEGGRRLLAQKLMQLGDRQIRDLFTVSQVEQKGDQVADWVRVFKKKRAEIVSARCSA